MIIKIKEPVFEIGDTRYRYKFCWLPRQIENYICWLESVMITEIYTIDSNGEKYWEEKSVIPVSLMKSKT